MSTGKRHVGIDVGSTTVKAVVLGPEGEILWKDYRRHHTRQGEQVRDFMVAIEAEFDGFELLPSVTGSGGRALAPHLGARYVQEVNAAAFAVEKLHPDTGSVVELGGQDAKVINFQLDDQGRRSTTCSMNDKCAGGTGATIDKIMSKIGVPLAVAAEISTAGRIIHPIAAKCGVFAETDVVGLLKSGVDEKEIVVSLCAAIVKQNLEVLVRGNVLRDKVLLLGGPHTFIKALPELWRQSIPDLWKLHGWKPADLPIEELVLVPPNSEYLAAIGAVLYGNEEARIAHRRGSPREATVAPYAGVAELEEYLARGRLTQSTTTGGERRGLTREGDDLAAFKARYSIPEFQRAELERGQTYPVWIGVDGGSTSSKLAVIDERREPIYKDYMLSAGNPIADLTQLFGRLGKWIGESGGTLEVRGAAVTGYASEILNAAFSFDLNVVETIAHLRSALAYVTDVDVICDVGGQDIKVLFARDGRVTDFKLNTQCSAGNGYFLQWIAEQFDVPIEEFADRALRAEKAPAFNCGCAVFMEQDKVNFQQLGWSLEEIMAGLALVLPLNIWNYVVQESNLARFGRRFVLQGGTQKNLAAVKSQVDFIRKKVPDAEIRVHPHADICGAIGAAIEAQEQLGEAASAFIGIERAARIEYRTLNDETTRCGFCPNRCPRTFIDIDAEGREPVRFISGNACDKGAKESVEEMRRDRRRVKEVLASCPNLAAEAAELVFEPQEPRPLPAEIRTRDERAWARRRSLTVGVPRLLNLFCYHPFFDAYLRSLGVGELVFSSFTTARLWEEGNKFGCIDPCFPAKVAPAHVYELLRSEAVDRILSPIVTHLPTFLDNTLGNNACVIQMGTSEVVDAAFTKGRDVFAERGAELWKPFVRLDRPREAEAQLLEYFGERLEVGSEENAWAVAEGYAAYERYHDALRIRGRETIDWLVANGRMGIVVLAHPYHHDPGLNHGLLEEFQKRGYAILPIEALPVDDDFLGPLWNGDSARAPLDITDVWPRNFNRNTNHKIWAANVVSRHPNLAGIDLSSFKCGHDAPTYSYVENIMNATGTPHFLFHDIDQNKPHASMKIRLETFDYFLKLEQEKLRAGQGGTP